MKPVERALMFLAVKNLLQESSCNSRLQTRREAAERFFAVTEVYGGSSRVSEAFNTVQRGRRCRNLRRASYSAARLGRIERAVIYREIHLLRLLQQTLASIKAAG